MKIRDIVQQDTLVEVDADDAVQRGLEDGDIGWAVRDVRPGYMNKLTSRAGWRQWDALIKSKKWRIVDLPIRQLIASQHKVNPDFRDAVLRYVKGAEDELPVVVKKSGHLVIMDGHHRIANAAYRGEQTIRCRYHDFDAPVPEPMTLFSESVDSPVFQQWFTGSQVVDQSGRPLVVYHGTSQEFDTFRKSRPIRDVSARRYAYNRDRHIGIWFTDNPESASFFSRQGKTGWQGSRLIPVYLSMKNPLVHNFDGARAKSPEMNLALAAQAKREGHDGLILRNLRDAPITGSGENVYIVFRPTQVKSAIGNSTYRTDSPRITEAEVLPQRPARVIAAFDELGQLQRGDPEIRMVKAQQVMRDGGVLGYAIEHVGDLTNRMSRPGGLTDWGLQEAASKIARMHALLSQPYGFRAEFQELMNRNIEQYGMRYYRAVGVALRNYAMAHERLPVYNEAQYYARQAAIDLGQQNFEAAASCIQRLYQWSRDFRVWKTKALEYRLGHNGNPIEYNQQQVTETDASSGLPEFQSAIGNTGAYRIDSPRITENEAPIQHPPVLYHGTSSTERESILQHGLLRSKSYSYDPRDKYLTGDIFFSSKPSHQTGLDTWQVDARGLTLEPDTTTIPPDEDDTWWVTYEDDIPPSRLRLVYDGQKVISEARMDKTLPANPVNVERAKQFLMQKWRERSAERLAERVNEWLQFAKGFEGDPNKVSELKSIYSRIEEIRRDNPEPVDLSSACKFVSLFAQKVFGGQLRGNWDHQYLVLPAGQILDLTEPSMDLVRMSREGIDPYRHDRKFFGNREHRSSMASCESRVNAWVAEFLTQQSAKRSQPTTL